MSIVMKEEFKRCAARWKSALALEPSRGGRRLPGQSQLDLPSERGAPSVATIPDKRWSAHSYRVSSGMAG